MIDKPSLQELLSTQKHFGLPRLALVEKDFYVVKALAAVAAVDTTPFVLVFGGGTSLSRAHCVVRRMSEDIDLKITGEREPRRSELRRIREDVTKALLAAGFRFDPENPAHRISRNTSRYMLFRLPYEPQCPDEGALRPEIQIEIAVWPLRCPAVNLPVRSFVAEAFGRPTEVTSIPCVAITQTAAEKFVGLTRRVGVEMASAGRERDPTLVRHIYDLHVTRSHYDSVKVAAMALPIMKHDAEEFGHHLPAYESAPVAETLRVLAALRTDTAYAESFAQLMADMVYGEKVTFAASLETLNEIGGQLPGSN